MYLPPTYPEQSADHEFPVEVVELVRAAAGPEEIRRTHIETAWYEPISTEQLPIGRPIRTEGRRPRRMTYVAVDTLTFEAPLTNLDLLALDLAPKLQKAGYTSYGTVAGFHELATPDYRLNWRSPSREDMTILAVIQAQDPYEPLRIHGPGGASIPLPELVQILESWKDFSSFEIAAADYKILDIAFRNLPPKLIDFAKSVYNLNPEALREVLFTQPGDDWDTIDYIRAADAQKPADLARHLRKTKHLRLIWP